SNVEVMLSVQSSLVLLLLLTGVATFNADRYEEFPSEMRLATPDRDTLIRVLKRASDMQIYRRSQSQNVLNRNRCFFSPVSC
ncbi:hypothetical protein PMAYCL1PPCAC_24423, partial [Pristionchus mayeri]